MGVLRHILNEALKKYTVLPMIISCKLCVLLVIIFVEIDCQDETRVSAGSKPNSGTGTSGVSSRSGGISRSSSSSSYSFTYRGQSQPVEYVKVEGVRGQFPKSYVPLVVIIRDIVRFLTGHVTTPRRCPPSRPCRTRRAGRCCPGFRGRSSRMVCPVWC